MHYTLHRETIAPTETFVVVTDEDGEVVDTFVETDVRPRTEDGFVKALFAEMFPLSDDQDLPF